MAEAIDLVSVQLTAIDALAVLVAAGGPYEDVTLHLATDASAGPFGPTTQIGDLVEATFTGYAAVNPLAWGDPYFDGDGQARVDLADAVFVASADPTASESISMFYLTTGSGMTLALVAGGNINPQVVIARKYDGLGLSLSLPYGA